MKLLLSSNGFSNKAIADALFDLVGKKPEDISLVFIPTASNVQAGDKDWFITVFLAVLFEFAVGAVIRDNLTLNVLNFIYQFDFIHEWQSGMMGK